jgi:hypothetical protein
VASWLQAFPEKSENMKIGRKQIGKWVSEKLGKSEITLKQTFTV